MKLFFAVWILTLNRSLIQGKNPTEITPDAMIRSQNYASETHTVQTGDGYLLTIYRIPGLQGSTPVFLQHGIFESAADFLQGSKSKSLAYVLSDQGYDVWLGNARGNTYSRNHTVWSTSDPQFWNFSFDELGKYDIPASISYISNVTNNTLYYCGHSMGASSFSIMASENPDIAKKVRAMFAIAPAIYEFHMKQPILKAIAPFWKKILVSPYYKTTVGNIAQVLADSLEVHGIFSRNTLFDSIANDLCTKRVIRDNICSNILFSIGGFSPEQLNYNQIPSILSKFPAGTSVKLFCHWLQQISVNKFRKFDYGNEENLIAYNSSEPPNYDLSKIQVPIAAFSSDNDWIVSPQDVQHFYDQIPRRIAIYKFNNLNHFDFLRGNHAPNLVHSKILEIMKNN